VDEPMRLTQLRPKTNVDTAIWVNPDHVVSVIETDTNVVEVSMVNGKVFYIHKLTAYNVITRLELDV
jgi:competence transcription factor ComK